MPNLFKTHSLGAPSPGENLERSDLLQAILKAFSRFIVQNIIQVIFLRCITYSVLSSRTIANLFSQTLNCKLLFFPSFIWYISSFFTRWLVVKSDLWRLSLFSLSDRILLRNCLSLNIKSRDFRIKKG